MERKRLDKEPEAETPLPHLRRASSMPASTSPPAQERHAREGISDPSAGQDREHSSWTGAGLAMNLPARMPRCAQALWPCHGIGQPRAAHSRRTSRPGRHRHLPASDRGRGPERLVWRTRTRLVRFADLRNGNSVLVRPTGEFVRAVAGSCAGLLHLHRSLPISQPNSVRAAGVPRTRSARARSASAPSCSSPSTCTGKPTPSIASLARNFPNG